MDTHREETTTALPNKLCCGKHKATEEQDDQEYLEKISGVRNGCRRIQVHLKEDGGCGLRQNWMEKSDLWPMIHWERQGISQSSKLSQIRKRLQSF